MRISVRIAFSLWIAAAAFCGEHPAPGTKIVHFGEVDTGVFKGSAPRNHADFDFLKSKQIKTILDLNFMPLFTVRERSMAKKYGIRFVRVPMNASPISPSEKHVAEALGYLRDRQYQPIYFHCELGRDRTSMVAALYRMYFKGMSQEEAWREMKAEGYKDWFGIHGLKSYFEKHPTFKSADADRR